MEELVTIKQEPEWIITDDYTSTELYKDDPNMQYSEYEIRPYYEGDIDYFADIKCKGLLRTADQLKIKGLCEVSERSSDTPPTAVTAPLRRNRAKRSHSPERIQSPEIDLSSTESAKQDDKTEPNKNLKTSPSIIVLDQRIINRPNVKDKTNVGGEVNGVVNVAMGYLDFAPEPAAPAATPVTEHVDLNCTPSNDTRDLSSNTPNGEVRVKFETLRSLDPDQLEMDGQVSQHSMQHLDQPSDAIVLKPTDQIKQERSIVMEIDASNIKHEQVEMYNSESSEDSKMNPGDSPTDGSSLQYTNLDLKKTWTQDDMESALDALRTHNMSLTKASVTYGIPSTTLWQRAHRLGIDTPKKEGPAKSWSEDSLNSALEALRTGQISANKASKAYGIPSSTLYKIARREGIRLAAPFNAAPTTWSPDDLERALEAIRSGQTSVQKASTEFGIPSGTLYGRCKREGIELSRANPTPWSEDAMMDALDCVRVGQMSINQAAIHYNLPYSSLYGRFKRGKYDVSGLETSNTSLQMDQSPDNSFQYSPGPSSQHQQIIISSAPSPQHSNSNHSGQHQIIYHTISAPSPQQQHHQQQQHIMLQPKIERS